MTDTCGARVFPQNGNFTAHFAERRSGRTTFEVNMAGRPRTPSNILEFKGSFKKDPKRRRYDATGTAPFCKDPPPHLHASEIPAWHFLVSKLPAISLANSDEVAVEISASLLARFWMTKDLDTLKELRAWLGKLGMSPQDRTKLPGQAPPLRNPFDGM